MKILGADGGDSLREYLRGIGSTETHPLLEGWLAKLERYRTDARGFARYWQELDEFRDRMFALLRNYDALISPSAQARRSRMEHPSERTSSPGLATR